ncbi:MAG: aspartate kinase [Flavobacteriales bacterium AspAUS03]
MKIKVYKFGGASVKDAEGVKNVVHVLEKVGYEKTFMIVSAMGKTTNALEEIIRRYFAQEATDVKIDEIAQTHLKITTELFPSGEAILREVEVFFDDLRIFLRRNRSPKYDFVYDQVIGAGELISTKIVSEYLNLIGIQNIWIDVRDYIKTDSSYREAHVDWELTEKHIRMLDKDRFYITQGFLGSDPNRFTTTLGREGSDYTAAIFAYCLDAESQTIWKDVPGILNADPYYFPDAKLLHRISYEEAIELAYYGASVIHPKTLQPLQKKGIPLYVRSFLQPGQPGTVVTHGISIEPLLPCCIVKKTQTLLSFSSRDFSFIVEKDLSELFKRLAEHLIKVNLIQSSAISFSVCVEDQFCQLDLLVEKLSSRYKITVSKEVSLYTIRHYDETVLAKVIEEKSVLLRQLTANTAQWIFKE